MRPSYSTLVISKVNGANKRNRGAKTAMVVALQSPELVDNIVSVDNAPVDAAMQSSFGKYIQAMRRIEEAGVTKNSEADKILSEYEEVRCMSPIEE